MLVQAIFTLLATSAWSVAAVPTTRPARPNNALRLIMTSPEDPGKWVTEEQKIRDYKSKGIGFVDITDITDGQVLAALSTPDTEEDKPFSVQAVSYPTAVSHQTEVNSLLTKVSTTNPQSWLKTLTEYVVFGTTPLTRPGCRETVKTLASLTFHPTQFLQSLLPQFVRNPGRNMAAQHGQARCCSELSHHGHAVHPHLQPAFYHCQNTRQQHKPWYGSLHFLSSDSSMG